MRQVERSETMYGYYTGIYRTEKNGNVRSKKSGIQHTSKQSFALELRLNGFRVIAILTDQDIGEIKNKNLKTMCRYPEIVTDYVIQHF